MRTEQDVYFTYMYPTDLQKARMNELTDACYHAYCWALQGLAEGRYKITKDNLYDVIDKQMKPDWIDSRPKCVCPWTTMRYMIREACNNWLDDPVIVIQARDYFMEYLKQKHKDRLYIPHSGMPLTDTVQIERVCRVRIDPVEIPTRVHLVIAHRDGDKWRAEIRAAKKTEPVG